NNSLFNLIEERKKQGFIAKAFQQDYYFFEIEIFRDAGFTNDQISFFGYTINQLKKIGFTNKQIRELSYYDEYYFSLDEEEKKHEKIIIINKLIDIGCSVSLLKSIGFINS
ncbi:hypothetical protein, partial [Paulownia witches'-broom phytoplasma]